MPTPVILHATSLAHRGRSLLILGRSGSGKSTLALQMLAFGAELICDDRTALRRDGDRLIAGPAPAIAGLIEARGVGLLAVPQADPAPVALAVDLDITETARLPPPRTRSILGLEVPLLHKVETPSFPAALLLYLRHGRAHPQAASPQTDESAP